MSVKNIVLMGLPASGKSTHRKLITLTQDYLILSSDDYIEQKAIEESSTYNNVFQKYVKKAEKNILDRLENHDWKIPVLWDQTNLTLKKQNKIKKLLLKGEYETSFVFMNTPLNVCLQRNAMRDEGRKIHEHIIQSMHRSIHLPEKVIKINNVEKTVEVSI